MKGIAMKTRRTLRSIGIIFLTLAILCVVCSATGVQNSFYYDDTQSTSITNTDGYSAGSFTGNYYDNPSYNNAIVYGFCRGGVRNSFYTYLTLEIKYVGAPTFIKHWGMNSVVDGSNILEHAIDPNLNNCDPNETVIGTVEGKSFGVTNSCDRWDAFYYCYWVNYQAGWEEP